MTLSPASPSNGGPQWAATDAGLGKKNETGDRRPDNMIGIGFPQSGERSVDVLSDIRRLASISER